MHTPVRTVTPDVTVETIRHLLLDAAVSGLPVVDADGCPIGSVSKTDVLRADEEGPELEELEEDLAVSAQLGYPARVTRLANSTVGEIMTATSFSLPESASIVQAARQMAERRIHRIFVVDDEGRISGVVSSLDILRWIDESSPTPYAGDN